MGALNKSAIKREFHLNGFRTSKPFLNALEDLVLIQVNHAKVALKKQGKKIARREIIYTLFPVKGEDIFLPDKTNEQLEGKKK